MEEDLVLPIRHQSMGTDQNSIYRGSRSGRRCNHCKIEEAALPVSLAPCHGCREAFYCSFKCRTEHTNVHICPKTISDKASFSRNCYLLYDQQHDPPDYFPDVTSLDDVRKKQLLDGSNDRILSAKDRTRSIHNQIREWNTDISKQFEEKPVPFSTAPLRMLHSKWDLIEKGDLEAVRSFVAVSYCWRTTEWQAVAEACHPGGAEHPIPISRCLWGFLLGLLESHEEAIWIDQLCIDQHDSAEKRSAVASMDALYASARLVFIALEDTILAYDEVLILSEAFRQVAEEHDWTFSSTMAHRVFKVVARIFSARWFSRAWCFHEYHMSANRVLAVPCEYSAGAAPSAIGLVNLGEFVFRLAYFQNAEVREEYSDQIQRMLGFFGGQDYALSNIIANTFAYNSKHPEDKLSIALNICQLDLRLKEDAATSDAARIYLLILALAAGDATILTSRGPKIRYGSAQEKVTWLHWPNETSWSTRHPFPLPRGISSLTLERVILDLLFIADSSLKSPSRSALRRAKQFLSSTLADDIRRAYNLQEKNAPYMKDQGTVETLACALDCGLKWMARAWRGIRHEVAAEVDQSFEAVKYLKMSVVRNLSGRNQLRNSSRRRRFSGALQYLVGRKRFCGRAPPRLTRSGEPREPAPARHAKFRLHAAYRMVLCIIIFGRYWEMGVRVVLGTGKQVALSDLHKTETTFRVPAPSEHKLYSAADYTDHQRQSTILAVPWVLAGKQFGMSDRLWLLDEVVSETGICWRVKEKVCLLGCPAVRPNDHRVVLRKRQMVVG